MRGVNSFGDKVLGYNAKSIIALIAGSKVICSWSLDFYIEQTKEQIVIVAMRVLSTKTTESVRD